MKISKQELVEMKACAFGLKRFIKQTNNTDEPVEVSSLIGGLNSTNDLLWLADKKLPKEKLVRFACDCALINIEKIKPYTDKYDLIVEWLNNPTEGDEAYAAVYTASREAYDTAYEAAYDASAKVAVSGFSEHKAAVSKASHSADAAYSVADATYAAGYVAADAAYAASDAVAYAARDARDAGATQEQINELLIKLFS